MLEEAAYVDPDFFYETVAPLMSVELTTFIAISTLTSDINFYSRLIQMRDDITGAPIFSCISVQLACADCIAEGKAHSCKHLLHLVPRWQSSSKHERLRKVMEDRPDLIKSELSVSLFTSTVLPLQLAAGAGVPTTLFVLVPEQSRGLAEHAAAPAELEKKGLDAAVGPVVGLATGAEVVDQLDPVGHEHTRLAVLEVLGGPPPCLVARRAGQGQRRDQSGTRFPCFAVPLT